MRHPFFACLAVLLFAPAVPAADPAREIVVRIARAPTAAAAALKRERLAERVQALGLVRLGALADGLEPAPFDDAPRGPFDLDPAGVWKLAAADAPAAARALAALARDPDVAWAELNQRREVVPAPGFAAGPGGGGYPGRAVAPSRAGAPAGATLDPGFPNDPLFQDGRQWGLHNLGQASPFAGVSGADVNALEAWAISTGSPAVKLAVADTGVDPDHPDLQGPLPGGGWRMVDGINVTGFEPEDAFADSFGHGTPVAGIVTARTNDGAHFDSLGVAGVCGGDGGSNPGCVLVPVKIAPWATGYATSFDIARAAIHSVHVGARAMNLSFAGNYPSRVEREALYYALVRGCVVVAASGNRGYLEGTKPQYPAAYSADGLCIQVGATDAGDRRASFSSYGPGLDLVAPGVDIWTTFMTYPSAAGANLPGYVPASGTSFAAPFVTGAVGLLASVRPELVDVDWQHVLRESARDLGAPGVDAETGWGRLDLAAALRAVGPGVGVWHDEVAGGAWMAMGSDTLVLVDGPTGGRYPGGGYRAELIEVTATVAVPDSFLGQPRVWARVGGTTTTRGTYRLPHFTPWAEVAFAGPTAFTLRGYLYRLILDDCPECQGDEFMPVGPDLARFGFTVMGAVDHPPQVAVLEPAAGTAAGAGDTLAVRWSATDPDEVTRVEVWLESGPDAVRLASLHGSTSGTRVVLPCGLAGGPSRLVVRAHDWRGRRFDTGAADVALAFDPGICPAQRERLTFGANPFRDAVRLVTRPGERLTIADLAGRVLRRAEADAASGEWTWDGRDADGRRVPPGVYLVTSAGPRGRMKGKLVRL